MVLLIFAKTRDTTSRTSFLKLCNCNSSDNIKNTVSRIMANDLKLYKFILKFFLKFSFGYAAPFKSSANSISMAKLSILLMNCVATPHKKG